MHRFGESLQFMRIQLTSCSYAIANVHAEWLHFFNCLANIIRIQSACKKHGNLYSLYYVPAYFPIMDVPGSAQGLQGRFGITAIKQQCIDMRRNTNRFPDTFVIDYMNHLYNF